jgi:hypothetical protein
VVFPDSTNCLESTEIELPANRPLNLDSDTPGMIEQKRDLWEWIVKNLDDAIAWTDNGNPIIRKFFRFRLHDDQFNIGLSDKDQELLDKLKIPDFIEMEKSKSPTPYLNRYSNNYQKPTVEITSIDFDRSQY